MSIELTEEQRQAVIKGEVVRLALPEIGQDVILLRADAYEDIRAVLEDEKEQKAFRQAGLRCARKWLKDNPY